MGAGACVIRWRDAATRSTARRDAYAFLPAEGEGAAPDPGRAGARRHHRAGPFPLHGQWRDRRAARGAARLCAQGHRAPDGRRDARAGRAARRRASPATARSPMRSPSRARSKRRSAIEAAAARGLSARADGRARADRQSSRRHRRHLQRRVLRAHACAMRRPARTRAARGGRLLRPSADDGPRRAGRRCGRSRRPMARQACRRCSTEVAARHFPSWSSSTTTPPRCRTAPSGPASSAPELARQFGAGGYVGRASGRAFDARKTLGYAPYDELQFDVPVLEAAAMSMRASGCASARSSKASR